MSDEQPIVKCSIVFKQSTPAFVDGVIHACIEDISYADSAGRVIAETKVNNVVHNSNTQVNGETVVAIEISIPPGVDINSKADYNVRVWVDVNNDDNHDARDLYSDQSLPVLTHGYGNTITLTFA